MLPIVLPPAKLQIGLTGAGAALDRRLSALHRAGVQPVLFAADAPPDAAALAGLHLLYIAGLDTAAYMPWVHMARTHKILLNVEDVPEFCDFFAVAEVRRGDLLLTVSTGGAAPGLAGVIRRALETLFPAAWAERVAEVAALRQGWRAQNLPMAEAARRIAALAHERCWLPRPEFDEPNP